MVLKRSVLFSVIAGTAFISAVHADEIYNRYLGQYATVGLGASYANRIYVNGKTSSGFLSGGGAVFGGTMLTTYFGPELGVQYYDLSPMRGISIIDLSGRFNFPIKNSAYLLAKLGAAFASLQTCYNGCKGSDGFSPSFGAGVGFGIYLYKSTQNGEGVVGGLLLAATHYFSV